MDDCVRKLAVTILADNCVSSGEGVLAEHGLSLLVEADGRSFLFDVGQSGAALGNAARLGIDLAPAREVVLSHGHYDHTGALPLLLKAFGPREVVAHPEIFAKKYARRRGHKPRSIGVPFDIDALRLQGAVLGLQPGAQGLVPGVLTSGPIARTTDFETIPSHFVVRAGNRMRRDQFEEEQAVIINTPKGLVVLVGCSHRGVVNSILHAMELTGGRRLHAVIGGSHLCAADEAQVKKTVDQLRRLNVGRVVACHCTGFRAAARLAAALGDTFHPGGVGYRFVL